MRKSVLVLLQQVGADPGMTRTSYLIETTRAVDSVLGFLKLSRLAAGSTIQYASSCSVHQQTLPAHASIRARCVCSTVRTEASEVCQAARVRSSLPSVRLMKKQLACGAK